MVDNLEDAADLIQKYAEIVRTKRQGIISVAYHQAKMFSQFREKEKFVRLVVDFRVHKGTIIFKLNLFRLLDKYPGLRKSSVTLSFMKNYFNDVNQICKMSSEFK